VSVSGGIHFVQGSVADSCGYKEPLEGNLVTG
jgi:hypothetical protein